MKKAYQQPTMFVVNVEPHGHILDVVSQVGAVQSNETGIGYGGASSNNTGGVVRVKGNSVDWDDWGE